MGESQGFRGIKLPEAEGTVRIATGNSVVEMVDCDEDMSLCLSSTGEESMEEVQISTVVQDYQPGNLHLEQGNLDLAGTWVDLSLSGKSTGRCITAGDIAQM